MLTQSRKISWHLAVDTSTWYIFFYNVELISQIFASSERILFFPVVDGWYQCCVDNIDG